MSRLAPKFAEPLLSKLSPLSILLKAPMSSPLQMLPPFAFSATLLMKPLWVEVEEVMVVLTPLTKMMLSPADVAAAVSSSFLVNPLHHDV